MQVKSLEQMDEIVQRNKSLSWKGWTVVEYKRDPTGWSKTNGVYKNSEWYVQKQYVPNENGWDIPLKFVS